MWPTFSAFAEQSAGIDRGRVPWPGFCLFFPSCREGWLIMLSMNMRWVFFFLTRITLLMTWLCYTLPHWRCWLLHDFLFFPSVTITFVWSTVIWSRVREKKSRSRFVGFFNARQVVFLLYPHDCNKKTYPFFSGCLFWELLQCCAWICEQRTMFNCDSANSKGENSANSPILNGANIICTV